MYIPGGRDPYAGRSAKTVLYVKLCTYQEEGTRMQGGVRRRCYINMCMYMEEGTRIARAECEDGAKIHIYATLQMIENELLCVTYMYVCVRDTKGMLDVLLYMIVKTSDTGHVYSYQHQLNSN